MKKVTTLLIISVFFLIRVSAQDNEKLKLNLSLPIVEVPENIDLPHNYPSMQQALRFSDSFYEVAYWGIDELLVVYQMGWYSIRNFRFHFITA